MSSVFVWAAPVDVTLLWPLLVTLLCNRNCVVHSSHWCSCKSLKSFGVGIVLKYSALAETITEDINDEGNRLWKYCLHTILLWCIIPQMFSALMSSSVWYQRWSPVSLYQGCPQWAHEPKLSPYKNTLKIIYIYNYLHIGSLNIICFYNLSTGAEWQFVQEVSQLRE